MDEEKRPLSPQEWNQWVELTKRVEFVNGRIPLEAFFAWCEFSYVVPVEFMGVRVKNGKPEILLIYRKDKYYNGYHTPGSPLVPGRTIEETLQKAVIKRELGEQVQIKNLQFVKYHETMKGGGVGENLRGQEVRMIFSGVIEGEPLEGEFFSRENLPSNIIPEFKRLVPEILDWAEKNLS